MTTIIIHRFFVDVQIRNIFHKLIQFHLCKFYAKKNKKRRRRRRESISNFRVSKVSISNYISYKFL